MAAPTLKDYELMKACFGMSPDNVERAEQLILKNLVKKDRQEFINRYRWYNLPEGLDGELIERILYYRGQGCFFYQQETDKFYFLPYCLSNPTGNDSIDCYGRYNYIKPLQFNGTDSDNDINGKQIDFIPGLQKKVIKDISIAPPTIDDMLNGAVLLHDVSLDMSQITTPKAQEDMIYLQLMAELPCMARTSLIANSGIKGMVVHSETEKSNVESANKSIAGAAKTGRPYIPMIGTQEFQELTEKNVADVDMFWRAYESFDNMRLSNLGLNNGGVFDKDNTYVNTAQAQMSGRNVGLIYDDGLRQRQTMADIANYYFGTSIYVDCSEVALNSDNNMDGAVADNQDQSGEQGEQPV